MRTDPLEFRTYFLQFAAQSVDLAILNVVPGTRSRLHRLQSAFKLPAESTDLTDHPLADNLAEVLQRLHDFGRVRRNLRGQPTQRPAGTPCSRPGLAGSEMLRSAAVSGPACASLRTVLGASAVDGAEASFPTSLIPAAIRSFCIDSSVAAQWRSSRQGVRIPSWFKPSHASKLDRQHGRKRVELALTWMKSRNEVPDRCDRGRSDRDWREAGRYALRRHRLSRGGAPNDVRRQGLIPAPRRSTERAIHPKGIASQSLVGKRPSRPPLRSWRRSPAGTSTSFGMTVATTMHTGRSRSVEGDGPSLPTGSTGCRSVLGRSKITLGAESATIWV